MFDQIQHLDSLVSQFERQPENEKLFQRISLLVKQIKTTWMEKWESSFIFQDIIDGFDKQLFDAKTYRQSISLYLPVENDNSVRHSFAVIMQKWGMALFQRLNKIPSDQKTDTLSAIAEAGCGSTSMPVGLWAAPVVTHDTQRHLPDGCDPIAIMPTSDGGMIILGNGSGAIARVDGDFHNKWIKHLHQALPNDALFLMRSHAKNCDLLLFSQSPAIAFIDKLGNIKNKIPLPFKQLTSGFYDAANGYYHLLDWGRFTCHILDTDMKIVGAYERPKGLNPKYQLARVCMDLARNRVIAVYCGLPGSDMQPLLLAIYDFQGRFKSFLARLPLADSSPFIAVDSFGLIHVACKRTPMMHFDPNGVPVPGPFFPPSLFLLIKEKCVWTIGREDQKICSFELGYSPIDSE